MERRGLSEDTKSGIGMIVSLIKIRVGMMWMTLEVRTRKYLPSDSDIVIEYPPDSTVR